MQTIEAQLRNAEVIEKNNQLDKVHLGNKVTVEEVGFDEETYEIVGSAEADPLDGRISNESPIGKALMGAKVGDTVVAETPAGQAKFKVIRIA